MTAKRRGFWCRVPLLILVLLLLFFAYNGLYEGLNATRSAATPGMRVATLTQLLYGACALLALLALATRRSWTLWPVLGWWSAAGLTGGLAPVVYGGQSLLVGLAAGLLTAVLLGLAVWSWRRCRWRPADPNPQRESS